jgi:hypothetical protein
MQPVASTRLSSASSRRKLHDDAMCITRSHASTSLNDILGNPSVTCFLMKQAARCRHVFHAVLPPSVYGATDKPKPAWF